MADCESRRCAQNGRCNCHHIYDDGSPVPGSGVSDDPYVFESIAIQEVRRSNGAQILVGSNGCATIEDFIQSILIETDNSVIFPDESGVLMLPEQGLTELLITDYSGATLNVSKGDTIFFGTDGDNSTDYVIQGYEQPTIVGSSIIFPQLKSTRYQGTGTLLSVGQTKADLPTTFDLFTHNVARTKTTAFLYSGQVKIEADRDVVLNQDDYLAFSLQIFGEGGFTVVSPFTSLGFIRTLIWDRCPGHSSKNFPVHKIITRENEKNFGDINDDDIMRIFFNPDGQLYGNTSTAIDFDLKISWDISVTTL